MKIVKVVHAIDESEKEKEKLKACIKEYDIKRLFEDPGKCLYLFNKISLNEFKNLRLKFPKAKVSDSIEKDFKNNKLMAVYLYLFLFNDEHKIIDKQIVEYLKNEFDKLDTSFNSKISSGIIKRIMNDEIFEMILYAANLGCTITSVFSASYILSDLFEMSSIAEFISLDEAKQKYPKTKNLSIGTYTLHPNDSSVLTQLENFHKNLAIDKDDELIVLLGEMGAKSITINEKNESKKSGGGSIDFGLPKAGGGAESKIVCESNKGKEVLVLFEGRSVEIDPNLLSNSLWYKNDSLLNMIFKGRMNKSNKMKSYSIKQSYSKLFDFDFKLAAKYLVSGMDLEAEYNSLKKIRREFLVEFGE